MQTSSYISDNLIKIATVVGLPVLGAMAQHLWSRYRGRLAQLRWTVNITPMAFATDDPGWGKVEILYDNQPTTNLHVANMLVQNASSRDLQNIQIDIAADSGTVVLRSGGQLEGSLQSLPLAPQYESRLRQLADGTIPPAQISEIYQRSDFIIPVMNRGSNVHIRLLLSRGDHLTPSLTVACDHPGVRLRHLPPTAETWGVRDGQAVSAGILLGLAFSAAAVAAGLPDWSIAAISWTTGLVTILIGAAAIKIIRGVSSLLD